MEGVGQLELHLVQGEGLDQMEVCQQEGAGPHLQLGVGH